MDMIIPISDQKNKDDGIPMILILKADGELILDQLQTLSETVILSIDLDFVKTPNIIF